MQLCLLKVLQDRTVSNTFHVGSLGGGGVERGKDGEVSYCTLCGRICDTI
jgi:hypothetical protein